jgi:hypothetical protein
MKAIVRVVSEPVGWQAIFRTSSDHAERRPILAWGIRNDNQVVGLVSTRRGLRPVPDWIGWSFAGYLPPGGDPLQDVQLSPPLLAPAELDDRVGIFVGEVLEQWHLVELVASGRVPVDVAQQLLGEGMQRIVTHYSAASAPSNPTHLGGTNDSIRPASRVRHRPRRPNAARQECRYRSGLE